VRVVTPSRALGLVALTLLLVATFTPLDQLAGRWLDVPARPGRADAIVVLGSSLLGDGTLSDTSLRRTIHGIRLLRQGLAPLVLFVGTPGPEGSPSEAEARATLARELGVPAAAILTGTARTTREEAQQARGLLEGRGVRRILLVSEGGHLLRAGAIFERAGFEVLPAPSQRRFTPGGPERLAEGRLGEIRRLATEGMAQLYYRVAGYL
jgi:uncharacterized SAM-binding protein YcdF (DUF218 family)